MRDSYIIRYDPTWPEFYYFSLVTLFYMKFIRGLVVLIAICGLLSSLLGMVTTHGHPKKGVQVLLELIGSVLLLPAILSVGVVVLSTPMYVMRPDMVRGHTYRFSAAGMERITPGGQFSIPWSAFSRMGESRSFFMLFVQQNNGQQIHFIQKRMFADADAVQAFRAFVELQLHR